MILSHKQFDFQINACLTSILRFDRIILFNLSSNHIVNANLIQYNLYLGNKTKKQHELAILNNIEAK